MTRHHSGRLTTTDASFLYFEREESPMHIGAVCILDGELPHEEYVARVASKLPRLPRFREKVVSVPFLAGHPTWETDPEFDIHNHMPLHRLPAPGSEAQLQAKVNELIAGMMDRSRPLWELHVIHGLEGGRSALLSKVHHAMVDGVGGNAIMLVIFDLERDPPQKPIPDDYEPTTPPDPGRRLAEALWDNARTNIEVWAEYWKTLTELGRGLDRSRVEASFAALAETVPDLLAPPRRLPFNRRCTGGRSFVWTRLSFAEARAVRSALGGTVNDVVLTTLGGAVGRYCRAHGQKTDGLSMRVMVPVNVRPETATADLGNLVSVLPVQVPLHLDDHEQRLRAVRATTRTLKDGRVADGVSLVVNLAGAVPAPLQAAFGAIATSPFPVFNIVCTNVPGPQIPLYALGHRLLAYYPHVPVGYDLGVTTAIFSYDQQLFVGINSDTGACSDVETLRGFFDECFAEIKQLAGVPTIAAVELRSARANGPADSAGGSAPPPVSPRTTRKRAASGGEHKRGTRKKAAQPA
jgi:WS/DGAT/MGAT family acyltransferase